MRKIWLIVVCILVAAFIYACSKLGNNPSQPTAPKPLVLTPPESNSVEIPRPVTNQTDTAGFLADEMIYLLAGKDCPSMNSGDLGPCAFPILVYTPWGITISDRVIASASQKSQTAPVWALQPFIHNPNT